MNGSNVISIAVMLLGLYYTVAGIMGMVQGKVYLNGKKYANQYTEESLAQFARPMGLVTAMLGVVVALGSLFNLRTVFGLTFFDAVQPSVFWGVMLALVVLAIVILFISRKKLVKK